MFSSYNPFNIMSKGLENNQFGDMFSMFKSLSSTDINKLVEMQKESTKSIAKISRNMMDTAQDMISNQAELYKSGMVEMSNVIKNPNSCNISEIMSKQAELAKKGISDYSNNMQELTETVYKSMSDIFKNVSQKAADYVEECATSVANNSRDKRTRI